MKKKYHIGILIQQESLLINLNSYKLRGLTLLDVTLHFTEQLRL